MSTCSIYLTVAYCKTEKNHVRYICFVIIVVVNPGLAPLKGGEYIMRLIKRNPVKKSHVLMWLARLRNRTKTVTQVQTKEQGKTDGVLGTIA